MLRLSIGFYNTLIESEIILIAKTQGEICALSFLLFFFLIGEFNQNIYRLFPGAFDIEEIHCFNSFWCK